MENVVFKYMKKLGLSRKNFNNCPQLVSFPLHFSLKCSFNSGNSKKKVTAKFNKNKKKSDTRKTHFLGVRATKLNTHEN